MSSDTHSPSQPIIILGVLWLALTIKTSLSHFTLEAFLFWMLVTIFCGVFISLTRQKALQ